MANYNTLISAIQAVITQNGNNEITGNILQQTLIAMIGALGGGYQFGGIATPETTPGTPDEKIFYLGSSGTYPNFGPAVIPSGNMGVFWYDTSWHVGTIEFPIGNGTITKSNLSQSLLNELLNGFVYAGIATPTGNPGSPLRDSFYMTTTPGTYTNYGNLTVQDEEIAVFRYVVSTGIWSKDSIALPETTEIVNNLYEGGSGKALSAEAGKNLNKFLFGGVSSLSKNDAEIYLQRILSGSSIVISRIRFIFKIPFIPATITASCALGRGVAISLYDTREKARINASDYIVSPTNFAYVSSYTGTLYTPGYLSITVAKSSGNFTNEEISNYINATTIEIQMNAGDGGAVEELKKNFLASINDGLTIADANIVQVQEGEPSDNGIRLRCVYNIPDYMPLYLYARCESTVNNEIAAGVYRTYDDALLAHNRYVQDISVSWTNVIRFHRITPGYLVISLRKPDNSAISPEEKKELISGTTIYIGTEQQMLSFLERMDNKKGILYRELDLGMLAQKSLTSTDLSDTNADKRVSMVSKIAVPYPGAILQFKMPNENICVGIRSGNTAGNLNNNDFFFHNGSTFTFNTTAKYFRLCFANYGPGLENGDEYELNLETVQEYIRKGEIKIFISTEAEPDIINRNFANEKYVKAIMRNFVTGAANNSSLTKLPVFAHTSDIHGDKWRFESFMRYCDYLNLDAAILTGDMVAAIPADSNQFISDVAQKHKTPFVPCLGNHDAYNLTTAEAQTEMIKGFIDKISGVYSEQYPTYYYKDFASKKIRIIALNLYETDHSGHNCNFTQTQCLWFVEALRTTPAQYGVLVLFHSPETTIERVNGNDAFYQKINNYWQTQPDITGTPILKIIDAFISKTSEVINYTSKGANISITADFTTKNAGVEFIAYLNGHEHIDMVGYLTGTVHKQLNLNVCCGIAVYGTSYNYLANNSDLPRGEIGATQDSFNIYSIDRAAKVVRIAKVGSNQSGYDLQERKYMSISYVD